MANPAGAVLTAKNMPTPAALRSSKRKRTEAISYRETADDDGASEKEDNDYKDHKNGDGNDAHESKKAKKHKKIKPTPPKNKNKKKIFPFLELPAEIRILVYEHRLVDPDGLELVIKTKHHRRVIYRGSILKRSHGHRYSHGLTDSRQRAKALTLRPAILAVNRQINIEATSLLYGQHVNVLDTEVLHDFLTGIGSANRALVRNVSIHDWCHSRTKNRAGLTTLTDCSGIESVSFRCEVEWGSELPENVARQIYVNGFAWLGELMAKRSMDATLDVIKFDTLNWTAKLYRADRIHRGSTVDPEEEARAIESGRGEFDSAMKKLLKHRFIKK